MFGQRNLTKEEIEILFLLAIEYFAIFHTKNFFLGNIKPTKLYFNQNYKLTSGTNTLLSLDKDNELDFPKYII